MSEKRDRTVALRRTVVHAKHLPHFRIQEILIAGRENAKNAGYYLNLTPHKETPMAMTPGEKFYQNVIKFRKDNQMADATPWGSLHSNVKKLWEHIATLAAPTKGFILSVDDPLAYDTMWEYANLAKVKYGEDSDEYKNAEKRLAVYAENRPQ